MHPEREELASRLGFLLLSAGCAIGLGNVWRFPYMAGAYGGAAFVLIYLVCLMMVMPLLVAEFSIGRASKKSLVCALSALEKPGTQWHRVSWYGLCGNYLLLMFYTVVTGWILVYAYSAATGSLSGLTAPQLGAHFGGLISNPTKSILGMTIAVAVGCGICYGGVKNSVETITKFMMLALFVILIVLVFRAVTLPGAETGISFYLKPNLAKLQETGFWTVCAAAMNQAFFTLSVGIGGMTIFGSYINRERSLTGEALWVVVLDTMVAILAGMVIFPACFAFGVNPGAGPALIFITLPNIFNSMTGGVVWGTFFFVFLGCAALSTVVGVFECLVASLTDAFGWARKKACLVTGALLWVLSIPCALGFNLWASFEPLGKGTSVLDLEDFVLSNNLLPLGAIFLLLFCTTRYGWGWEKFIAEANSGKGAKLPHWIRPYLSVVLPCIIAVLFVIGYMDKFCK